MDRQDSLARVKGATGTLRAGKLYVLLYFLLLYFAGFIECASEFLGGREAVEQNIRPADP